ncbi:hypothetical protein EST38_g648 [Candolleomyces aberdarensis]|uniref:SET domain-containing protein n=1 Tax=Candolleomyces aberdarensis TaxID=2316362 RepID=A0A4Q2DZF5_9AGAR|nr:hypothetical protein EST38_g648 [Candolleomyces aberdarensis]
MKRGFLKTPKANRPLPSDGLVTAKSPLETKQSQGNDRPVLGHTANAQDHTVLVTDVLKTPAIITAIPSTPSSGIQTSQVVTVAPTKELILQNRSLARQIPTPSPVRYAIRETEDMGRGLFATRDVALGENVLVERPLVVLPKNIGSAFKVPRSGQNPDQWHEVCMDEAEKLLGLARDRMNEEDRKLFESLCNISAEDPQRRPLVSILVSSAMNLHIRDAPMAQNFGNGYVGIPRLGSRINHSCIANAVFNFDPDTFLVSYTATRDIKAGEQVFLAYFPATATLAQRRQGMGRYRFVCKCSACTNATEETDKFRAEAYSHIDNLVRRAMVPSQGPGPSARDLLAQALKLKDQLEREGLDVEPKFSEAPQLAEGAGYKDSHVGFGFRWKAIGFNVETVEYKNIKFQVWDLGEEELKGVPLLVFCNKQDVQGAAKPEDVSEQLGLAGGETSRPWSVRGSCAVSGQGLEEGLDWLVNAIQEK